MQLDRKKLFRQLRGCMKFIQNGGRGTLEWCTGMGKTFAAMILIKRMQRKNPNRTALVVVPTIQLKEQWEKEVKNFNLTNVKVMVINSIVLQKLSFQVDMLILDEIHRFASNEFIKIFSQIKYRFILGLTATIERLDGKESILVSHAPVVDTVSLSEARMHGWISEFIEFNLGVTMTRQDEEKYEAITASYNKYFKMFGFDFDLAIKCQAGKPTTPGGIDGPAIRKQYATLMGWNEKTDSTNKLHPWHPDNIAGYAMQFGRFMRMRKEYLYNAECKVDMAIDLINHFSGKKIITFSESTAFADQITSRSPGSVSYHSYITGETMEVGKSRLFKTEKSAINFLDKNLSRLNSPTRKGSEVFWTKSVRIPPKKVKSEILRKFSDDRYALRVINTARALDQGTDIKDIEVALILSRTTNPTQLVQRTGRTTRKFTFASGEDKVAIIINVYIKNTQDEKWLKKSQSKSNQASIRWIDSPAEISLGRMSVHNQVIDAQEPW